MLVAYHPQWVVWQLLTPTALTEHFWLSILYLQQTPPIPNMIFGLIVKLFGWPHGTARALVFLQALLSVGTALFLFHLLVSLTRKLWFAFLVTIVFLLSTDILVIEYGFLGQLIYENLAMFLLLVVIYCWYGLARTEKRVFAAGLGLSTGALALTRASFSYFFIIPGAYLVFALIRKPSNRKLPLLLIYILSISATHFAWSAKNFAIYRTCSLSTSSWKGCNFADGLSKLGRGQKFAESILDKREMYPPWFCAMIENHGLVIWRSRIIRQYIPQDLRVKEDEIQRKLDYTDRAKNSIGQRIVSDLYMKAYTIFFFRHPKIILDKFITSYKQFWEPIRNYSPIFLGPLFVDAKIANSFNIPAAIKASLAEGICDNQYLMQGTMQNKSRRRICFYTVPYIPSLALIINLVVLHLITPLVVLYRLWSPKKPEHGLSLLFLFLCYLYAAFVMNLPEYGENMRFRLSIEPMIWLISVYSIMEIYSIARAIVRRRRMKQSGAEI